MLNGITHKGLKFFETSAKENINVKSVFELLVDMILEKMAEGMDHDAAMTGGTAGASKTGKKVCEYERF
ncbi:unnamed protein product [Dibothriocephalus latus]|uniref:Uncharacterized protein n=1 Tax=Dibothriocephalus latus TaxID=60516 RepID=A0A3P6T894_DIBLA|nr:unnamed protein product [Dibothriocephalus latus]